MTPLLDFEPEPDRKPIAVTAEQPKPKKRRTYRRPTPNAGPDPIQQMRQIMREVLGGRQQDRVKEENTNA
jgi:hypothetical protein